MLCSVITRPKSCGRYRASHLFEDIISDRTSLILRYTIQKGDFTHGGTASSYIKRALLRLGANPQIARRCGIAAYEAEMNLIIHTTNGGMIRVEIEPHQITLEAYDDGPGIKISTWRCARVFNRQRRDPRAGIWRRHGPG